MGEEFDSLNSKIPYGMFIIYYMYSVWCAYKDYGFEMLFQTSSLNISYPTVSWDPNEMQNIHHLLYKHGCHHGKWYLHYQNLRDAC